MNNYPAYVRNTLNSIIEDMGKHIKDYCSNPDKDFTRKRKLTFETVISFLVKMGGHSLRDEMLDILDFPKIPVSVSALSQQRKKILPKAMEYLFHRFTNTCEKAVLYKGYRLLAVDGTSLQIATNPNDTLSHFDNVEGKKSYNLLHLNALYDLSSKLYSDAVIQKEKASNENAALVEMVERADMSSPAIIIADRNYEAYNTLETIVQKGWKYIIRLRESAGIISNISLPEGDFDIPVQMYLTRKKNKTIKQLEAENPGIYKYMPSNINFKFLPPGSSGVYPCSFRIVRFKISDSATETIITNLDADTFSSEELKNLYNLRWGIETSFRQLKYTIGLNQFQSKKVEYITQEIFARLIMYNFCELITSNIVIQDKRRKYTYQINFAAAAHICRKFLRGGVTPPDVEALISAYIVPIRPGRSSPRKKKNTKFNSFFYRIA